MKILFLSRYSFPHVGGVEKHIEEIGKRLAKQGHAVTVISEKTSVIYKKNKRSKFKVFYIPITTAPFFKKFTIWYWLWKHRSLIHTADVVHCHDVFFWYLPFRFLYFKKPVYTTFHGYESYPIRMNALIMRKIAEYLSFGNICIGAFITKWYKTHATFISYGAVKITKGSIKKNKNKHSALFIGRLDEQTGILDYAKAVKCIREKIPDFEFLVIGDGKFRKNIKKDGKTLGSIKNPQKYLKKYRFAFISRYLSILEAFAERRLVFAMYDNPLKEDYLKMTPFADFIITVGSPALLAKKVFYYLDHPKEEKKKIELAYEWVSKQTWEKLTQTYFSLWS